MVVSFKMPKFSNVTAVKVDCKVHRIVHSQVHAYSDAWHNGTAFALRPWTMEAKKSLCCFAELVTFIIFFLC